MVEQLHRTEIRIATEAALGSGEAEGDWWQPPIVSAAASRGFRTFVTKKDIFRNTVYREPAMEEWMLQTSHEMGTAFFNWVIATIFPEAEAGTFTVSPEAQSRTYVIAAESEGGHRSRFKGVKISEISIRAEESRIVSFDIIWIALDRIDDPEELPEANQAPTGDVLATFRGASSATQGEWDAEPRATQAINIFAAQIFLTRQIQATQYGADGIPTQHTRAPWEIRGEIYMPETEGITDQAYADNWEGKIALFFGTGTDHVRIDNASCFLVEDDLKSYDFRIRRLILQAMSDDNRNLAEFRR